jgi:hypothetical protein
VRDGGADAGTPWHGPPLDELPERIALEAPVAFAGLAARFVAPMRKQ